jgi:hypothetical protein
MERHYVLWMIPIQAFCSVCRELLVAIEEDWIEDKHQSCLYNIVALSMAMFD